MWNCHRSTDNRYSGDNRLIGLESSHRQPGLAPLTYMGWRRSDSAHALANNGGALYGNIDVQYRGKSIEHISRLSYWSFLLVTKSQSIGLIL